MSTPRTGGGSCLTPDQYVATILAKYAVPRGSTSPAEQLGSMVAGPIRTWAGAQLNALQYSGSYAKETGVHGISDVDVFISLKSDTRDTLQQIYDKLAQLAEVKGWSPRLQNVSIGVTIEGTRGDLVPGKVQAGYQNYHSLYLRKRDSWTQTNIALHAQVVRNSGRMSEIRAIKIWRMLHGLEIPSLYLELFTIRALSARPALSLADNVLHCLRAIGTAFQTTRIEDPANTNNILSDALTPSEKRELSTKAVESASKASWGEIIW